MENLRGKNGFTLIETLVALTLLVAALIPLAKILTVVLHEASVSKARAHAREIAESERDYAKSLTFNAIGQSSGAQYTFSNAAVGQYIKPESGYSGISVGPDTTSVQNYNYSITRNVVKSQDQYGGPTATYTKKVIITVTCTNPGLATTVSLTTEIGPTAMAP